MISKILRGLIAAIAGCGIVVSSLALHVHNMDPGLAPPCAVSENWDCGAVNHSRYAVFPPKSFDEDPTSKAIHIPVATVGIVAYSLIAILRCCWPVVDRAATGGDWLLLGWDAELSRSLCAAEMVYLLCLVAGAHYDDSLGYDRGGGCARRSAPLEEGYFSHPSQRACLEAKAFERFLFPLPLSLFPAFQRRINPWELAGNRRWIASRATI